MNGGWRVLAQREIAVKLRDRAFVGATIVTIVILVAMIGLSGYLANRTSTTTVAAVGADATQIVALAQQLGEDQDANRRFEVQEAADVAAAERVLENKDADVAFVHDGDWEVVGLKEIDGEVQRLLAAAVSSSVLDRNAAAAGTSVAALSEGAELGERVLQDGGVSDDLRNGAAFFFAFLFYVTALTFGIAIAQSVVEEKQSRVVEILAAAMPLRQLLIGKVVGNSALAIAQVVLLVGVGAIALALVGQSSVLAPVLSAGGWFVVFFLLGFAAIACAWAVAGSVATRAEDLQSTTTPLTVLVMTALFAGIFAKGTWLTALSFVPLVSSVAMPVRMLDGGVPLWQPLVSALIVMACAAALIRLGSRLYEGSLLRTERRTSLREAFARG